MAEVAAVFGLVASIASLVEISFKVVSRIQGFAAQSDEVPASLRALADRLPLLTGTLQRVQDRAQAGQIQNAAAAELERLVRSLLDQVKFVEQCLGRMVPAPGDARLQRVLRELKSLSKDEQVKQAVERIHNGIDVLVLHQTTSNVDVRNQILDKLVQLSVQSPPVDHKVFGLCLGRAPQIESDAFLGRKAELEELRVWLSPESNNSQSIQKIVSIVDMGGLGKTQLSLAFARECGHQYSSVFWINVKDESSLRQSIAALVQVISSAYIDPATSVSTEHAHIQQTKD